MTPKIFRLVVLFAVVLAAFGSTAHMAQAHIDSITVPCSGAIEMPAGGLRAASDGDTYMFEIVPGAHTEIYDQHGSSTASARVLPTSP